MSLKMVSTSDSFVALEPPVHLLARAVDLDTSGAVPRPPGLATAHPLQGVVPAQARDQVQVLAAEVVAAAVVEISSVVLERLVHLPVLIVARLISGVEP